MCTLYPVDIRATGSCCLLLIQVRLCYCIPGPVDHLTRVTYVQCTPTCTRHANGASQGCAVPKPTNLHLATSNILKGYQCLPEHLVPIPHDTHTWIPCRQQQQPVLSSARWHSEEASPAASLTVQHAPLCTHLSQSNTHQHPKQQGGATTARFRARHPTRQPIAGTCHPFIAHHPQQLLLAWCRGRHTSQHTTGSDPWRCIRLAAAVCVA